MKKCKLIFSSFLLLIITCVSAQEINVNDRNTIEIEIVKDGKVEKGIGYLIMFDMKNLKAPYTAVILEKSFIENTKNAILYFPMKNGEKSNYQIEDISKYLFTEKSNNLAIIRLGELATQLENQTTQLENQKIYANVIFVPEELLSDFSFPLDKIKLKELKESWEQSMLIK